MLQTQTGACVQRARDPIAHNAHARTHTLPRAAPWNIGRLPLQRRTPAHVFLPASHTHLALPAHGGPPPHICFSPRPTSSKPATSTSKWQARRIAHRQEQQDWHGTARPRRQHRCNRTPARWHHKYAGIAIKHAPDTAVDCLCPAAGTESSPSAVQPGATHGLRKTTGTAHSGLQRRRRRQLWRLDPAATQLPRLRPPLKFSSPTAKQPLEATSCYRFQILGTRRNAAFCIVFLCFCHVGAGVVDTREKRSKYRNGVAEDAPSGGGRGCCRGRKGRPLRKGWQGEEFARGAGAAVAGRGELGACRARHGVTRCRDRRRA